MDKISKEEQNQIIKQLKIKYKCDEVNYLGYLRFALIYSEPLQLERGNNTIFPRIRRYRLVNEEGIHINLKNEYNFIAKFIKGVAEVWNQIDFQIEETNIGQVAVDIRKYGLINTSGNELLPVIYDNVHAHPDGFVEISKDGIKKTTSINVLERGDYSWDDPYGIKYIKKKAIKEDGR